MFITQRIIVQYLITREIEMSENSEYVVYYTFVLEHGGEGSGSESVMAASESAARSMVQAALGHLRGFSIVSITKVD